MTGMLDGKAILVTGAGGGIGSAAARLFAREGAMVAVVDRTRASVEPLAREIDAAGMRAVAIGADLSVPDEIDAMVATVVDAFGRLDGAFNNAGVNGAQVGQGGKRLADWDADAFDAVVRVNLLGTWHCLRAEIHQMQKQGAGGAIVNTASLAGVRGFATTGAYTATKHAVVGLTRTAAMEYAPDIRVNALLPGYVDTTMLTEVMARAGDQILAKIPYGRLARPEEIAQMACWLLSDRASYASGGAFAVDGGFTAG